MPPTKPQRIFWELSVNGRMDGGTMHWRWELSQPGQRPVHGAGHRTEDSGSMNRATFIGLWLALAETLERRQASDVYDGLQISLPQPVADYVAWRCDDPAFKPAREAVWKLLKNLMPMAVWPRQPERIDNARSTTAS